MIEAILQWTVLICLCVVATPILYWMIEAGDEAKRGREPEEVPLGVEAAYPREDVQ